MEIFDKIILKENMIKEEQERYVVESKTFFKGLFLIFLPLVPLIYYFLNRKNKNPNIRNFARAVKNVNLIYSILFLIIGLSFFLFFNKPMTSTLKKNNVKVERLENKTNKDKDNHTKKVVDQAWYKGLRKFTTYHAEAVLMDYDTHKPILVNGGEVRQQNNFIVRNSNKSVQKMSFKVDSSFVKEEGKNFAALGGLLGALGLLGAGLYLKKKKKKGAVKEDK